MGLRFGVLVRTLRDEDAGATPAEIAAGWTARCVLPWMPLMRGAGETGMIEEWKRLAAAEPDAGIRGDYGVLAKTFAARTDHQEAWEQALEGWNMQESAFLNEIRAQGELKGSRHQLLQAIRHRFLTAAPSDLAAAIDQSTDLAELDRWLAAVFTSPTLDAYRAAIGR